MTSLRTPPSSAITHDHTCRHSSSTKQWGLGPAVLGTVRPYRAARTPKALPWPGDWPPHGPTASLTPDCTRARLIWPARPSTWARSVWVDGTPTTFSRSPLLHSPATSPSPSRGSWRAVSRPGGPRGAVAPASHPLLTLTTSLCLPLWAPSPPSLLLSVATRRYGRRCSTTCVTSSPWSWCAW